MIDDEQESEAKRILGEIVYGLLMKVTFVRLQHNESVFNDHTFSIQASLVRGSRTALIKETFTPMVLLSISDPQTVVDAMWSALMRELRSK